MDTLPDGLLEETVTLDYDDTRPYEDQTSESLDDLDHALGGSLADRIGHTKVYLISDTVAARTGKRKYEDRDLEEDMEEDVSDPSLRDNAILFRGPPISYLPTENIFAYATHFDAQPVGLEWIDDITCILVFPTKAAARGAFRHLAKSHAEEPSQEGFITAKPIPIAFWPPEERINKSLGKSEGLKGAISMRWAMMSDIKKRGANKESKFYQKYGNSAGKPGQENTPDDRPMKRRREGGEIDATVERARLDDDLDTFLAGDDSEVLPPPSPPSKMRSDYINSKGKTLLERTSEMRHQPSTLESRMSGPRRSRDSRDSRHRGDEDLIGGRHRRDLGSRLGERKEPRTRRTERPRATQEELDAELDAFLNSKD